jgi:D-apionolactonase
MVMTTPTRAVKLTGTEQPDSIGRILTAGPLSAEFDNGNLRYIKMSGVEVLRAMAFLVRDENWGTYTPALSNLKIDQRKDGFTVSYQATCSRLGQQIDYAATIEGKSNGNLTFRATGKPKRDFLTNRTGFVVLHPLQGVVGQAVKVEHTDGSVTNSYFPEHVNPDCPFRNIRALSHQALPGVWARCQMEGDAYEMEDHRNWTDASFKTYIRPLAKPWPYTLPAGQIIQQSVSLSFSGALPKASRAHKSGGVQIKVGGASEQIIPPIGVGVPAEEIDHALSQTELVKMLAPNFMVCFFDPRQRHGVSELSKYRRLGEKIGAEVMLEIVVQSLDDYAGELDRVAEYARLAGLKLSAVAVCPVGHLKSVLPGGTYPPAPALENLYAAARNAFPRAKLGGGMFSFFTELNRKRPPAPLLDFITNTTCPIVHAADDRSVMETLEALPSQIETAKAFSGGTPHRVGPSGIGARDNPHGATYSDNPNNLRVCLAKMDPRQRGLFSAAWTLGYVGTLARAGVSTISMGAPTGPLGMIYREAEHTQPFFDDLEAVAVYPVFHTMSALNRASGNAMLSISCSDERSVACFGWNDKSGNTVMIANLTTEEKSIDLAGVGSDATIGILDEDRFVTATTNPKAFRKAGQILGETKKFRLGGYAVAYLSY